MQTLYFSYGSNMNLNQMDYRCPAAVPVGAVQLDNYRLAFCGSALSAVATVLPEQGSHVDGVLWRITSECEQSLDRYEGYPHLYGKEQITVTDAQGHTHSVMVYTMNTPHRDRPGIPSNAYADGILTGAEQNGIAITPILKAIQASTQEFHTQRRGVREVEQLSFVTKPKRKNWYTR